MKHNETSNRLKAEAEISCINADDEGNTFSRFIKPEENCWAQHFLALKSAPNFSSDQTKQEGAAQEAQRERGE